jgi:hypothetical protein
MQAAQARAAWLADLGTLAQLKRHAVDPAVPLPTRQAQMQTAGLADQWDVARVKRHVVWKTSGHAWGR